MSLTWTCEIELSWNPFCLVMLAMLCFWVKKTPVLLEQYVLEGGGMEVKFKQKRKMSIKNASLCLEAANSAVCSSVHLLDF